jgi:Carboxypeptidase regulatory-like domain
MKILKALAVCLAAVLYLALPPLGAQSTAILTGSVSDSSQAVIAGAVVVCTNTATHLTLRTVTNSNGLFRIPDIPVGSYELNVQHPGFTTLVRGGIDLLTDQTVNLSLMLQLGETTQSIAVTAPAPLVQGTTSDIQTTVTSRQMADLPLNGRNAFQLAVLMPGAVSTDTATIPGQQDNTGLAVNGFRPTDNNWMLDGGAYTNRNFGSAPTLPNPDTLQEFTALTSNFSAQNRGGGAVIKLTTRSGTNQLHGTLFEFLRNNALDTRNFFSIDTEVYKQNQYGGTAGGPIRKNRLFFFGSYQGMNKRGSPSPTTGTVPSADQHNADFNKTGHPIIDPTVGEPFPNNVIPRNRWDSIGAKLLAGMPLPNIGVNTILMAPPAKKDDSQYTLKIDYVIGARDHLSGRYFQDRNFFQRDVTSLPGYFGADTFWNKTVLVTEAHTFSPSWVMENSFNYLQTFRTEAANAPATMQALGANVKPAMEGPNPAIFITLTGYTRLFSSRGLSFNPAVAEWQSSVSHAVGSHFIRFGGSLRHNHEYALNLGDVNGAWTFNTARSSSTAVRNSGDAIGSLLLGLPTTFVQGSTASQLFVSTLFDFWMQDDWKVSRRLTLNLGLRYDPWIPARDADGVIMGFVPGAHSTIAPLAPAGLIFSGDPGTPDSIFHNHWKQFGPRAGFAWDVSGGGRTIIRGGYGLYTMGSETFGLLRTWSNAVPTRAVSISISSPPSTADPYAGYTGTVPFPFTPPKGSQLAAYKFPANLSVNVFDPSTRPGYTQSWNLTIERQLRTDTAVSVAYIGNHFLGSISALNINAGVYGPGATLANLPSRRPYQGLNGVTLATAYGHGAYNGLQLQVTKRPTRGLTLLTNYTWSKSLDVNSSGLLGGSLGEAPRNPYNINLDKGPADFDHTHAFKATALYDLPRVAPSSRAVRALANGWQVNSIFTARTGFPFTCRSNADNSLSGVGNDTCDQVLANTARPAGADPLKQWFNTAAFTPNAIGTFGQTGRGILRRPNAVSLDASLFRLIPMGERVRGELRVEVFNVLNHPNFDLFNNTGGYSDSQTVNSAAFGAVAKATDPRLIQIALKLRF